MTEAEAQAPEAPQAVMVNIPQSFSRGLGFLGQSNYVGENLHF